MFRCEKNKEDNFKEFFFLLNFRNVLCALTSISYWENRYTYNVFIETGKTLLSTNG